MEERYLKLFRTVTLVSGLIFIAFVLMAWYRETFMQQWKDIQAEYKEILITKAQDAPEAEAARGFEVELREIVLAHFERVDRCVTCHPGIEDPRMTDVAPPHRAHSGNYLVDHPAQKFGCTICHGGQGRALDVRQAFAREAGVHWLYPLLGGKYIQSSCGKCHLALFSENPALQGTDVFQEGHQLFNREGCLGCHKARSVGGTLGPDLTEQGNKTRHEYDFRNISGEQTIPNWLWEHFIDPEMVSPGSQMLKLNLPEAELNALVIFTLGLAKPNIPFEYFSVETLNEFKGRRETLPGDRTYALFCSACHGKEGEGKNYKNYKTGVPGPGNRDFLSAASDDFITFTIKNGRGRRQMAAWLPRFSGLKESEITATSDFIRNWREDNSSFEETIKLRGNIKEGEKIFQENCRMCHGEAGRGGVALRINNPDFLKVASPAFLFQSIHGGRRNTAMPSWSYLSSTEMANLLAYIRSLQTVPLRRDHINLPKGDAASGELLFHYLCSRCHGQFGEGGIGPAVLNEDFLSAAGDDFLRITIAEGRSHTAMFGWMKDVQGKEKLELRDISDLIAFMRAAAQREADYIYPGATLGKAEQGKILFQTHCAECHGVNGEGVQAPALHNQELLSAATNGYFLATISLGREGTEMPSWGRGDEKHPQLSGEQRLDIVAFLRSWQTTRIKLK
jgi:mono/diheme cytochrome c family protein